MDKKLLKEEYKRLLTKAIEGRPGGMALMIVLEETDFYNSPASAKHHLNVPGGLLLHSLNVARAALELCENMPQGKEVAGLTADCYSWHDRMVASKPSGGGATWSVHNENPQRM